MGHVLQLHGLTGPGTQPIDAAQVGHLIMGPGIQAIVSEIPMATAAQSMEADTTAALVMRHHTVLQGYFAKAHQWSRPPAKPAQRA